MGQLNLFGKGSQVEVSSDDEGLKGAWYVATVLEPPPTSGSKRKSQTYNKIYLEYHSLLADEDGSKPLRERVDVAFVRPSPPPGTDIDHSLELNDVVDAFYRDGWWTGAITRVLDNSRFVVSFQNPPDELEFGISELRVHQEWVDGKWVRPEKQITTGLMFSTGKKVEVSIVKEDYGDVWFPAIVLEDLGNDSFLVEYQSPGISDDPGLLRVVVDSLHIRPSPPRLKDKKFILLEKVDAFYDFGWWNGVITKELADCRYVVFFKHTNKERELNLSELRPQMQWKDGKWFIASQDLEIRPHYQDHAELVCDKANDNEMAVSLGIIGTTMGKSEERTPHFLNLRENQIEKSTHFKEKALSVMNSRMKKTKQITPDDTLSAPSKKLKEGNVVEAPSVTASQSNTTQMSTPSKIRSCGMATPTTANTKIHSSEQTKVSKRQKIDKPDNQTTDPVRRKRGRPQSQISSPQASAGGKIGDSAGKTVEDLVEEDCVTKEIDIPVITGLECNGMSDSRAKKPNQFPDEECLMHTRNQKLQIDDLLTHKNKEGNNFEVGGESSQKKRRGRPPKLLAVEQQNGEVAAGEMVVKDCLKDDVGSPATARMQSTRTEGSVPSKGDEKNLLSGPSKKKNKSRRMMKIPLTDKGKLSNGKAVQSTSKGHEKHSSNRGRQGTVSLNTESPIQGKTAEASEKDCSTKQGKMDIEIASGNISDDQPLSMWFEGMHSPTTVNASSVSLGRTVEENTEVSEKQKQTVALSPAGYAKGDIVPIENQNMPFVKNSPLWKSRMHSPTTVNASSVSLGRTLEENTEASEKQKQTVVQSPAAYAKGDIVPIENKNLPFVKNSPLWKSIESMEVFRMIPQEPHWSALECYKESFREGLAIGSMVNFSSVVENTSRLQFEDSRSIIEDYLEALVELESHGFDVKVVRERLTRLLLAKDKQVELEEQSKEVESEIMKHKLDKTKIDEEIEEMNRQIREIEEKRASAMSTKEIKDSEIGSLESRVSGLTDGITSVRLEFEGLAAAPW